MTRNSNLETRITTADGRTWVETYRNSFGGYMAMLDRVAAKLDSQAPFKGKSPRIIPSSIHKTETEYLTHAGTWFATGPVLTDADRVT